jgi:4'-phosphopantetheinyl transferase
VKAKVYIETSVVSYVTARPSRDLIVAARQEITSLSHWLSDRERAELNRMSSFAKRDKRIVAWGRLRFILSRYLDCAPGDIQIARARFERPKIVYPEKTGLWFNLSHSGSFGLAGISRNAVGIDIEKVDPSVRVERLAMRFFSSGEAERLRAQSEEERIQMFFRLWVLKEAHLKSHGAQVPAGLSQCEIIFEKDVPRLVGSEFGSPATWNVLTDIPVTKGYAAALAGVQERADISVFDL